MKKRDDDDKDTFVCIDGAFDGVIVELTINRVFRVRHRWRNNFKNRRNTTGHDERERQRKPKEKEKKKLWEGMIVREKKERKKELTGKKKRATRKKSGLFFFSLPKKKKKISQWHCFWMILTKRIRLHCMLQLLGNIQGTFGQACNSLLLSEVLV